MKKPQLMALAAALALAATGVHAESYNDNGSPVNGSGINIDGPYVPSGGPICPSGPVVSAFTGATTQLGRIFRDGEFEFGGEHAKALLTYERGGSLRDGEFRSRHRRR